ncbi:MAG: 4-alpha-glucanotransferase [Sideroxydans sp.]
MLSTRSSGILLHPTSLPGPYGSGDFGHSAFQFVDWLQRTGQTFWQVLPMGEVGPGNSPYMSSSAFAGSLLLIDIEDLVRHGWLQPADIKPPATLDARRVNYDAIRGFRLALLRRAARAFQGRANPQERAAFLDFCQTEAGWLADYALFMAIQQQYPGRDWSDWPPALTRREPEALAAFRNGHAHEIEFWLFCQWRFATQWFALKQYANQRGVRIVGDVPIFVANQSADVWGHQDLFELDGAGRPLRVAGVPPDYFSEDGQLWGNPLYRWEQHRQTGYAWWLARMRHALRYFDLVRVDHFRGFASYWAVPADAKTAREGQWLPGPGGHLFETFQSRFGRLPVIAEDLGLITPDVIELRDRFQLPGMRILQFAFGEDERNYFLPHHYVANCVAYTGTHDNDTSLGWWRSARDHERAFATRYLKLQEGDEIHWKMMEALSSSAANTVIFPMQDVLGLGSEGRMNLPGSACGNWEWRFDWEQLATDQELRLAEMTARHGRKHAS